MRCTIFAKAITVAATMVAGCAYAATQGNGTSVAPTLEVKVNVLKAIRLTFTTSGCVAAGTTTDYKIDFGDVDALGISAGCASGGKIEPATPGESAATYYSSYELKPIFTNQSKTSATIKAHISTSFGSLASVLSVMEGNASGSLAEVTGTDIAHATVITAAAANKTPIPRYIGVSVKPDSSDTETLSGAGTATVTYTMTIN